MGYYEEELEELLSALEGQPNAQRLLASIFSEASADREELLRATSRESILEEELSDLYAEFYRLQFRSRLSRELDENTVDLSKYTGRSEKEDSPGQDLPEVGKKLPKRRDQGS